MRTIKLYGELGRNFGRVHRLRVKSPGEAIRALSANFPEFRHFMINAEKHHMGFRVINGKSELETEAQVLDPASGEIKIIPVVMGSGANQRILVGAILIAAAVVAAPFTGGSSLAIATNAVMGIGISLALGGVMELISPPPKPEDPKEKPENDPSYGFNGPVNTTAQGHPVPVGYGRLIVGGALISAGLSIEQLKAGFKRIQEIITVDIDVIKDTGGLDTQLTYEPGTHTFKAPPANMIKRVVIAPDEFDVFGRRWHYRYSYYKWSVVPV